MTEHVKDLSLSDKERTMFVLIAFLFSSFLAGLWFYLGAGSGERSKLKKYLGLQFMALGLVWLVVLLATSPPFFLIVYYLAMKNTGLSSVHLNPIVFIWFFVGAALTTFTTIFFLWCLNDLRKRGRCDMPIIGNLIGLLVWR